MTPEFVLIELIERLGARHGAPVFENELELNAWPSEAVAAMKSQGLLKKARPAASAVCPGCERECIMPVNIVFDADDTDAFIVCDKRSDVNRVPIDPDRLTQWQCTIDAVIGFVTKNLGLRQSGKGLTEAGLWEIGICKGNKRSQMLCLKVDEVLSLVAGGNSVPLADLINFNNGKFALDDITVHKLVDAATGADPRHTPNNARRESRKLDTQTMYQSWQKAYRKLKKENPNKSDSWIALKIAKMEIGKGRDSETIRKNMVKIIKKFI